MPTPSLNGDNGRDRSGRFAPGNSGGPGNPHAKRVNEIRASLLAAVTPEDVKRIIASLIAKAVDGDVTAAREILDRTIGKPVAADMLARVEALEARLLEGATV